MGYLTLSCYSRYPWRDFDMGHWRKYFPQSGSILWKNTPVWLGSFVFLWEALTPATIIWEKSISPSPQNSLPKPFPNCPLNVWNHSTSPPSTTSARDSDESQAISDLTCMVFLFLLHPGYYQDIGIDNPSCLLRLQNVKFIIYSCLCHATTSTYSNNYAHDYVRITFSKKN